MSTARESVRMLNSSTPTDSPSGTNSARPPEVNYSRKSPSHITLTLLVLALACSLGFFQFGYQIIVLNGPGDIITTWINQSYVRRGYETTREVTLTNKTIGYESQPGIPESTVLLLYGVITGALSGGGIIGALFTGVIADRVGRRGAQTGGAAVGLFAAALSALSGYVFSPELLVLGRVLFGISSGAATALAPMYLVESSPSAVRGTMSTLTQLGCVVGLFFCQIIGLPQFLGSEQRWPLLFFVAGLAPAAQIILTLFSPESPRYLYISRNQSAASLRSLGRLRSIKVSVKDELEDFENEAIAHRQSPPMKLKELLTQRQYLWPLSIAIVLHLSQTLCGVQGIQAYSSILFQRAGLSATAASYTNLAIGIISIVTAIVMILLIDRLGRRVLHLGGLVGMVVAGVLIVLFSKLSDIYANDRTTSNAKTFSIATIVCQLAFHTVFSLGPASIPWTIMNELFNQKARVPAISICGFVSWSSTMFVFVFFPSLNRALGVYVFLPFISIVTVFLIWLWKYMPETKGRTFRQISDSMERR